MSDTKIIDKSEIFILTGHRKSGTSMFHRLFDGHPEINLYPVDLSILYAYFPCFTRNVELSNDDLRQRLKHVIIHSLNRQDINYVEEGIDLEKYASQVIKKISDNQLKDKKAIIKTIKDVWIQIVKKNTSLPFVFKETTQAIFFQDFKKSFPNLKMIALIRDPRDNYAAIKAGVSKYYSKMGESEKESLASVINRARMDLRVAEINQKEFPDSFMAIKFEDLLKEPEKMMKKVAKFLNISFTTSLINPTIEGKPYKGNSHDGKVFSGISTINLGRWKERISPEEAKIIEFWLRDEMEYWNYSFEYDTLDSQQVFSDFYEWYNCHYFYYDSFKKTSK